VSFCKTSREVAIICRMVLVDEIRNRGSNLKSGSMTQVLGFLM
jgi:hypothetical protein